MPVKGKPRFCLGEGSYSSSLGVPSTTLTITGLLPRWPPAHQTSCLSQCPGLATALSNPSSRHPDSLFPSLDKASFLQAPRLLTAQCAVCLGQLSSCFVCRGKSWAKGAGIWLLGTQRPERQREWEVGSRGQQQDCAWGGSARSPGCGRHSRRIWWWWRGHYSRSQCL